MERNNQKGIPVDIPKALSTTEATIFEVPEGYILEIDEIVIQNGGTAGEVSMTDEGTYKDGITTYEKTAHVEYLAANGFDDTRNVGIRCFATLKGIHSTGDCTVIIKGRMI